MEENVYARDVEDEMVEHPEVSNAAMVDMSYDRLSERVEAFVETETNANSPSLTEVIGFLKERGVVVFRRPHRLEVVESLPRTEVAKINKATRSERIVEEMNSERTLPEDY